MPQKIAQLSVADNLVRLAKEFQSGDPAMATGLKKEFKQQSKNDLVRSVVYLMEVIGSRDEQYKRIDSDNKDLKEILKLNDINLDEGYEELNEKEKADAAAKGNTGSNGVATAGTDQSPGDGGTAANSNPTTTPVEGATSGAAQAN